MVDPLQMTTGASGAGPIRPVNPAEPVQPGSGKDFRNLLLDSLNEVNRLQDEANEGVQALVTGQTENVAEVMAAVNKAGIAFDLLMEVRNKLTEAYQEMQQIRV